MNVKIKIILSLFLLLMVASCALPSVHFDSGYIKSQDSNKRSLNAIRSSYKHIKGIISKYQSKKSKRTLQTDKFDQPDKQTEEAISENNTRDNQGLDQNQKMIVENGNETEEHEENKEDGLLEESNIKDEREQIKTAVALIEFKLVEINELIKECIEEQFKADLMADKVIILRECAGLNYQILFNNYKEGMRRVKQIFLEILRKKLRNLDPSYADETEFFLDILEDFVDKDLRLLQSLEVSKQAAKFYVKAKYYDHILKIANPEIQALHAIHHRLHLSRNEVQDLINKKVADRDAYLANLRKQAHKIEEASAKTEHDKDEIAEPSVIPDIDDANVADSSDDSNEDDDKDVDLDDDSEYNKQEASEDNEDEVGNKKSSKADEEEEKEDSDRDSASGRERQVDNEPHSNKNDDAQNSNTEETS